MEPPCWSHTHTHTLRKVCVCLLVLLLCWCCQVCEARPSWTMPAISFIKKFHEESHCDLDSELMELCQRCAKATKSNNAYPMCCADQDNAVNWCKDYVYFGIQ